MIAATLKSLGFLEWATGGGCMALGREFADGTHVLVTDMDGTGLPRPGEPILIGFYSADRESRWLTVEADAANWWPLDDSTRCADCGTFGETTGHMTCPYPKDHE